MRSIRLLMMANIVEARKVTVCFATPLERQTSQRKQEVRHK